MPFTEDLSVFFDEDGFGTPVVIRQRDGGVNVTVVGIFDDEHRESVLGLAGMATSGPRFQCAAADVAAVQVEDTLTKDGTPYFIAEMQPDGTGVVTMILRLAQP